METLLFPLSEYWWLYGAFTGLVLLLLTLDLGVFHRTAHVVGFREATAWSDVWVGLALLFGYGFYLYALHTFPTNERLLAIPGFDPQAAARQAGLEYLTGYIVEKSLAVDNIFVFVVVFSFLLPRGRYVVEVELNTRREDISPALILPAAPVSRSIPVELR